MLSKLPRLTAEEAERKLLKAGFEHLRSKGSHRIYQRDKDRFILPFHKVKILHPKIIKALMEVIEKKIG